MDKIEDCDGVIFSVSCFQGAVTALTKNLTDHLAFFSYFTAPDTLIKRL
jgi:NAD(P)H-dependent FMN reductase